MIEQWRFRKQGTLKGVLGVTMVLEIRGLLWTRDSQCVSHRPGLGLGHEWSSVAHLVEHGALALAKTG